MGLLPRGEAGGAGLVSALDRAGVDARWVVWDDEHVDWQADLVVARSTWDYHRRLEEFLAWAWRVERISPLLNGHDVFAWNADKAYLLELGRHVPVVPTRLVDDRTLLSGVAEGLAEHGSLVVKPRTGAGGRGVVVVESPHDGRLAELTPGPWVVQPLVESVRTTGETSVYVLDGLAVSQVDKLPAGGEIRVHEEYGGRSRPVSLGERTAGLAESAVRAAARLLGRAPAYARVDMVVHDDVWTVGELELIEPGLYLDVDPANAWRFAELVVRHLPRAR
jgi:glutathione synthase/RimK-type ligase-like ATP-grasp enzyme